jgi:hypothetical protein
MRQLRVESTLCQTQRIMSECEDDYTFFNEENGSFEPGWINETTQISNSSIAQSFKYRSNKEFDTYVYVGDHGTYNGGGYVYELRGRLSDLQSNLSQLHHLGWIDDRTRAIFIQISLYNPNAQLFTSVTLLTEFLSTGELIPQSRFEPFNFRLTFNSTFQLICAIVYVILIGYFMFNELQSFFILKLNYFRQFWSYIELGIILCSWASVGIYIQRYQEFKRIGNFFQQTNGYVYINLQLAVYVDDILTFLFSLCCFFGTIRFVYLGRFNQRLLLFIQTLKYSSKELISFSFMFLFIYLAFLCLFYLLFISHISSCSTMLKTAQMLFEMILLKFDTSQLIQAGTFLGPFCFCLFIFLVVFICLSMFFTIINKNFRGVRENITKDEEIFLLMFERFVRWTGLMVLYLIEC